MNNAKDAIDTLDLNRSNLFTINMHTTKGEKAKGRLVATSYYYTLSNTKEKVSGGSANGVLCTIKSNSKYVCNQK